MTKTQKKWGWVAGVVLLLLVGGYLALTKVVDHFLNDGALARAIGKKTAVILKADAGYLPLYWRGLTVRSGGLLVRGKPPNALTELQALNLRASCSLSDLWARKFVVRRLHADWLETAFGAAAGKELKPILATEPELQPQVEQPSPLKVEIRETVIDRASVFWGENAEALGSLREVLTKFYTNGSDLDGVATGGTFEQTGWPKLRIVRIETHYAKPKLELRAARFAIGQNEDTTVTGRLDLDKPGGLHLQMESKKAPAEPFLKGFWRGKFEAKIDGQSRVDKIFGPDEKTKAAGELNFADAEFHDVPTLDQIAALTRHPQFAHLKMSEMRGRYDWNGTRLEVSDLQLEAKQLFRIEGHFTVADKEIDGDFQIGASADVLDSIPGAREKVFTKAHDGYFWTTMKMSGPLKHPREDLKDRLVAAAQEQLAQGFLAPLLKPGQGLLELLKVIYPAD